MNHTTNPTCWRCETNQLQIIWSTQDGDTSHTVLWCGGCEMPQQISANDSGVRRLMLAPVWS